MALGFESCSHWGWRWGERQEGILCPLLCPRISVDIFILGVPPSAHPHTDHPPPTAPAQHLSFLPSVAGLKMGREAPGLLSPRPSWAGASSPGCGEGQVPLSLVTQISGLDKHTSPEHTHWECLPIGPQASFPQQAHHSSQLCGLFEVPSFSQHQGCLST